MTPSLEQLVPDGVRSVLVFGGTFDPPHRAHVELPRAARDRLGLDWLLYVPASMSPLKDRGPEASESDRLAMLRAAIDGAEGMGVSDIEYRRGGVSYTAETLRLLRDLMPGVRAMRLLIGADQAAQFHKWRSAEEIIGLAEPAVMLRGDGGGAREIIEEMSGHWDERELERWSSRFVDVPALGVSSTLVRAELSRGVRDHEMLKNLVPERVLEMIEARQLYR